MRATKIVICNSMPQCERHENSLDKLNNMLNVTLAEGENNEKHLHKYRVHSPLIALLQTTPKTATNTRDLARLLAH